VKGISDHPGKTKTGNVCHHIVPGVNVHLIIGWVLGENGDSTQSCVCFVILMKTPNAAPSGLISKTVYTSSVVEGVHTQRRAGAMSNRYRTRIHLRDTGIWSQSTRRAGGCRLWGVVWSTAPPEHFLPPASTCPDE